mgnify:CR=1 FL=1
MGRQGRRKGSFDARASNIERGGQRGLEQGLWSGAFRRDRGRSTCRERRGGRVLRIRMLVVQDPHRLENSAGHAPRAVGRGVRQEGDEKILLDPKHAVGRSLAKHLQRRGDRGAANRRRGVRFGPQGEDGQRHPIAGAQLPRVVQVPLEVVARAESGQRIIGHEFRQLAPFFEFFGPHGAQPRRGGVFLAVGGVGAVVGGLAHDRRMIARRAVRPKIPLCVQGAPASRPEGRRPSTDKAPPMTSRHGSATVRPEGIRPTAGKRRLWPRVVGAQQICSRRRGPARPRGSRKRPATRVPRACGRGNFCGGSRSCGGSCRA